MSSTQQENQVETMPSHQSEQHDKTPETHTGPEHEEKGKGFVGTVLEKAAGITGTIKDIITTPFSHDVDKYSEGEEQREKDQQAQPTPVSKWTEERSDSFHNKTPRAGEDDATENKPRVDDTTSERTPDKALDTMSAQGDGKSNTRSDSPAPSTLSTQTQQGDYRDIEEGLQSIRVSNDDPAKPLLSSDELAKQHPSGDDAALLDELETEEKQKKQKGFGNERQGVDLSNVSRDNTALPQQRSGGMDANKDTTSIMSGGMDADKDSSIIGQTNPQTDTGPDPEPHSLTELWDKIKSQEGINDDDETQSPPPAANTDKPHTATHTTHNPDSTQTYTHTDKQA